MRPLCLTNVRRVRHSREQLARSQECARAWVHEAVEIQDGSPVMMVNVRDFRVTSDFVATLPNQARFFPLPFLLSRLP